ncbi:MerR family transcriptional regulator [Rhodoblastus sp.]|uniref:MerR family transcriptional regulator n=1 Tax=Rhodoblastus sp. TaxID=1962975 RepID=UPI003F953049
MEKTQDAFRTIGEVAEELDLPQHVLRFWETKFTQIKPVKRVGGRRYYRPDDVHLVAAIRILLHNEGYTIKGVQRILREQGARAVVAASRGDGRSTQGAPLGSGMAALAPLRENPADLFTPLEATDDDASVAAEAMRMERSDSIGGTFLSSQDRHRMEGILAELGECVRLLDEARRK